MRHLILTAILTILALTGFSQHNYRLSLCTGEVTDVSIQYLVKNQDSTVLEMKSAKDSTKQFTFWWVKGDSVYCHIKSNGHLVGYTKEKEGVYYTRLSNGARIKTRWAGVRSLAERLLGYLLMDEDYIRKYGYDSFEKDD